MRADLESALTRIERRVGSLYFNGYFTRAVEDELAYELDIVSCFRIHIDDTLSKNKIHSYFLPERDVIKLLIAENLIESRQSSRWKDAKQEQLLMIAKQYQRSLSSSLDKVKIKIASLNIKSGLSRFPEDKTNILSKIYIPLVVNACTLDGKHRICSIFTAGRQAKHQCNPEGKATCRKLLRGVIEFYSAASRDVLKKKLGRLELKEETFLGRINKIFCIQDEPDCYGKPGGKNNKVCRGCPVRESCWIEYPKGIERNKDVKRKTYLTQRLNPDEVIAQLFERCKEILPKDVKSKIAFLKYRADVKKFQYMAVKYMEISAEKKNSLDKNDKRWWDKIRKDSNKNIILHPIVDITKDIFDTLSGELIWGKPIQIKRKTYKKDKRIKDDDSDVKKLERIFFEYAFFVAMPVFYLGQLLGFIFANFEPPRKDNGAVFKTTWEWEDFSRFQNLFFNLSIEFGPLLYNSLVFDFISNIIKHYSDRSSKTIHEAVMKSLPAILNVNMIAFWGVNDLGKFAKSPNFLLGVKKSDKKKLNNDYVLDFYKEPDELSTSINLERYYKNNTPDVLYPIVDGFKFPELYQTKGYSIRTALLIPIIDKELKRERFQEGIYILFFERLSPYILQRNALDIVRETSGIFKVVLMGEKGRSEILRHATRAAVAAIMGRNMSHNIGSHVLSYWSRRLQKYSEMLITVNSSLNNVVRLQDANNCIEQVKDISMRDRIFFEYLRSRMDFIAEISTTDPAWASTMLFCQDIILPFVSQTVLLNYLVMSENIHFEPCCKLGCLESESASHHRITIKVYYRSEILFEVQYLSDKPELYYKSNTKNQWTPLPVGNLIEMRGDIPVLVPHGLTGIQAFYSILENFIRNSAKHGNNKLEKGSQFSIIFDIDDTEFDDLIKVSISDNLGNCDKSVIKILNDGLTESLVNKNGVIKPGNWGLKEKKISSCFLRMGGSGDIDKTIDYPPKWSKEAKAKQFIMPSCTSCKRSTHCSTPVVSYDFYLMKPKEALIIGGSSNRDCEKLGIFSINKKRFTAPYIKRGVPHRFLIIYERVEKSLLDKNKDYLPIRQLKRFDGDCSVGILPCYKAWLKKKYLTTDIAKANIVYRVNDMVNNTINNVVVSYNKVIDLPTTGTCNNLIVFDDHGEKWEKLMKESTNGLQYYQGVSAANPTKRLLLNFNRLDSAKRELAVVELAEAALTKVLIVDERIWEANSGFERIEKLCWMNIGLLPIINKKASVDDISKFLKAGKPDFFIIHQGLLDKMEEHQRKEIDKMAAANETTYVIASGRGQPNDLRSGARFLEISALEHFINEDDKYGLVQTLYSLRRYGHV